MVEEGDLADTSTSVAPAGSIFGRISSRSGLITAHKFFITVQLLDQNHTVSEIFKKNSTGQEVLDHVCKKLNIIEKEYFGLQYEENKFRYWVDLSKPLSKQFHYKNLTFRFRFRFYPSDPTSLKEAVTRYQLFVQLRRDLLHGRLSCPQNDAAILAGLILQANLGDYNEKTMGADADYVSEYQLLMKQSQKLEEKIAAAHQCYCGLLPEDAENEFLNVACKLDTYGFDPYVVKNLEQTQEVIIGANHSGILIFLKNQKIHSIRWSDVEKVDYIVKHLIIVPSKEYVTNYSQSTSADNLDAHNETLLNTSLNEIEEKKVKKVQIKLVCPSANFAKHLWRHLLSQQVFFNEDQATLVKPKFSKPRIPLFSRGSTFRCPTLRVLNELVHDETTPRSDEQKHFERYTLQKYVPRSADEPWHNRLSKSNTNSTNDIFTETPLVNGTVNTTKDSKESINATSESSEINKTSIDKIHGEDARNGILKNGKLSTILANGCSNSNSLLRLQKRGVNGDDDLKKSSTISNFSLMFTVLVFIIIAASIVAVFILPGGMPLTSQLKLSAQRAQNIADTAINAFSATIIIADGLIHVWAKKIIGFPTLLCIFSLRLFITLIISLAVLSFAIFSILFASVVFYVVEVVQTNSTTHSHAFVINRMVFNPITWCILSTIVLLLHFIVFCLTIHLLNFHFMLWRMGLTTISYLMQKRQQAGYDEKNISTFESGNSNTNSNHTTNNASVGNIHVISHHIV